jgi:hypothetical protein
MSSITAAFGTNATMHSNRTTQLLPIKNTNTPNNTSQVEDSCAAHLAPTALVKFTRPAQQLLAASPNNTSAEDTCAADLAPTALAKYTNPAQQLLAAIPNNTSVEDTCAAQLAPTALVINPAQQLLAAIPNNTSVEDNCAAQLAPTALVRFIKPPQQLQAAIPNSISVEDSCAANPPATALVKYATNPQQQYMPCQAVFTKTIPNSTCVEASHLPSCSTRLLTSSTHMFSDHTLQHVAISTTANLPNSTDTCPLLKAADTPGSALASYSNQIQQIMAVNPNSTDTCPLLKAATTWGPPASANYNKNNYNHAGQQIMACNTGITPNSTAVVIAGPPTCAPKLLDSLVIDNGRHQLTAFNADRTVNNATCAAPFRKPVPALLSLTTPLTCAATYTTTIPTAPLATAAAASNSWRLLLCCAAVLSAAEAVIAVLVAALCPDLLKSSIEEEPKAGSEEPKAAATLQSAVSSIVHKVTSEGAQAAVVCGGWKQALSGSALRGLHMCDTFHQQQTNSTFTTTSSSSSSSTNSPVSRRTKLMKIDETSSSSEEAMPASPTRPANFVNLASSGESRRSGQLSPGALQGVAACLVFHQQQQSKWVSVSSSASKSPKSHPIEIYDEDCEDCEE